ncbi:MAG: YfiM family protein [Bacteroidia bacterium]|nr:YfiM family protein [Bacteroidia bacterium]
MSVYFRFVWLLFWGFSVSSSFAQQDSSLTEVDTVTTIQSAQSAFWNPSPQFNKTRAITVMASGWGTYAACYSYLALKWYAGYETSSFHWFDDWPEWKQMDKIGHSYSAYLESLIMMDLMRWAGFSRKQIIIWGGMTGFLMQSPVEILDGFSKEWGASWGDLAANAVGSGLAIGNELLWREQRVLLKWSYYPSALSYQYPRLLGSGADKVFKDYNGQTYWICLRVHSFLPKTAQKTYPRWLNLAIGYGAEGMQGGYFKEPWEVIEAREYRQVYLSLDIDVTQIKVKKPWLKFLLSGIQTIKLPFPALRYDRDGLKLLPIHF